MNQSVLGCMVVGFEDLIDGLKLPDLDDRHVLAAAIHCGADAIVTFNLRHFPEEALGRYELEAVHPDAFLHYQFELDAAAIIVAARRCRARLSSPAISVEDYLSTLDAQSLPLAASNLRNFADLI